MNMPNCNSLSLIDVVENRNAIRPNLRVIIQRTATAPHPPKLFHSSKQSRVNVLREACRFFDEKNIEKGSEILCLQPKRLVQSVGDHSLTKKAQLHWHFKDRNYDSLDKDCKK